MLTIYKQIADRLRTQVAALKTIDVENNQLDNPEDNFPIVFPAAFIDVADIEWSSMGNMVQQGLVTLTVTVAVLPRSRSHQGNPDIDNLIAQMQVINDVNTAIHGYRPIESGMFTRISTRIEKRDDQLKTFTHTYQTTIIDSSVQIAK